MLIAEDFFLIAIDPRTGLANWPRRDQAATLLTAAALALELVVQTRLHLRDGLLQTDTQVPLAYPLLSSAAQLLHAPLPALPALKLLAQRLDPLPQQVLDGLFRRDLMHRNQHRDWLLRKQVRYPLRSMQARNEALQHVRDAISNGDEDLHGLALLLLLDICGLLPLQLQARDHERAMRRLLALNAADAESPEALQIFAGIRTALLA